MQASKTKITTATSVNKVPKVVFIDFDGVILKNAKAQKYIVQKIENVVSSIAKVKDARIVSALNKEMYNGFGHTYIGLKRMGYLCSLKEFNEYVYGNVEEYKDLELTDEERQEWLAFEKACKESDISLKLFSNADKRWLANFIEYDQDLFSIQDRIDAFHEPLFSSLLKPEKYIYDILVSSFPRHKMFCIDDKLGNFGYMFNDPRWHSIWYNPLKGDSTTVKFMYSDTNKRIVRCSSLDKVLSYVEHM